VTATGHDQHDLTASCVFPSQFLNIEMLRRLFEFTLAALIRMVDRAGHNSSAPERHLKGVEHQLGAEMVGHRPACHHPAKGVDHHGQEEEPGPGRDVGR
jgi:hypothetical protein